MIETPMKLGILFFLVALFLTTFVSPPTNAQSPTLTPNTNAEQWRSHQMNQPSPSSGENDVLSNDRLEEIRQLYMEAKREAEKKPPSESRNPHSVNHQMK
jgi:hypothetical protein